MTTPVRIIDQAGDFAEDKNIAATIREQVIRPAIESNQLVELDFIGVSLTTQSFIHALVSDVLRTSGEDALGLMIFRGCEPGIRGIIETVVQYSLETMDSLNGQADPKDD